MYEPSKNTVYIAIAFTSIAALVGAYSYWDDISYALCDVVKPELNNGEVRLVDDEGKSYTLINHGDGKETALYDDAEKSDTFHSNFGGRLLCVPWLFSSNGIYGCTQYDLSCYIVTYTF